jgi:hypothetical protein
VVRYAFLLKPFTNVRVFYFKKIKCFYSSKSVIKSGWSVEINPISNSSKPSNTGFTTIILSSKVNFSV